ncbi:MAG: type IV pilus secretin PilQ, partial [Acidobacteriota bacterium]
PETAAPDFAPAPQAPPEPGDAPAAFTPVLDPASQVTGIQLEGPEESPIVTIDGDGALEYESFELTDPYRLVFDFKDVINGVQVREIPVHGPGLEAIRVSQFRSRPDRVTRVVFDLSRPEQYRVESTDDSVIVHFEGGKLPADLGTNSPQAPVSPEPAPVTPADLGTNSPQAPVSPEPAPVTPADLGTNSPQAPVSPEPTPVTPADLGTDSPQALVSPKPAPGTPVQEETSATEFVPIPDVEPASSSLGDLGKNVVLFDQSEPAMQGGSAGAPAVPTTTLPASMFESKTIAGEKRKYHGDKISVSFRDADLREVMFFFADVMKMNVILDPEVTGKVDIRLNQVPWDQAFQVILKNQGLQAMEEDNVIRIARTSRLQEEASQMRALQLARDQAVEPVTFMRTLSYVKAQEAMNILRQVQLNTNSTTARIVADVRTNTIIITDIPKNRPTYEGLLDAIDTQTPQVIIEARIVEAFRSFERDIGINWTLAGHATPALGTQTDLQFPHRVDFTADVNTAPAGFPSAGSIGLMLGNVLDSVTLDVALQAFEADGRVRILSSPKITTQNNQPATLEQGTQIPVVTTTATEVDVQYVPASLRLIVTPQITAEDTVIMKLRVENNQPSSTVSVGDVPGISTESVDTQILVRTGTTAVIGGIYKLQESDNETGIPGLRKIPFFGWLFKNRVIKKDSSELLVFITPKIVKNI